MSAEAKPKRGLSRRQFLIIGGLGASLALGVSLGMPFVHRAIARWIEDSGGPPAGLDGEPTAWFRIDPDNRVRLYIPKVEMGQGVHTSLAQIAAEELAIDWADLEVQHAATGQGLDDGFGTSGSSTVTSLYLPLREAAASMRQMLLNEASLQLGQPLSGLSAANGRISSSQSSLSYGEIVAAKEGEWQLPEETPALKAKSDFEFIGQSLPRVDLVDKVQGKAVYGFDQRVEGMLYGAVLRPPSFGARLRAVGNQQAAKDFPGVEALLIDGDFVGVAATTREAAYAALTLLTPQWDQQDPIQQADIENSVSVGQGKRVVIQREGDGAAAIPESGGFSAEYRSPMAFHAHLEPQAATVDASGERVEVWVSTQTPVSHRNAVAEAIGRSAEDVRVQPLFLGGGFGRKVDESAAVEAARLSDLARRPVHVGWSREEDFQQGFVRPPVHNQLSASLDAEGRIEAIEHRQASGGVAFPFFPAIAEWGMGADFAAWRGSYLHYAASHKQTTTWLADLPIPTGWWRGLGVLPNIFALESFIDELAHSAGIDPLEFRLRNLPTDEMGQRMAAVLNRLSELANWGERRPGIGKGLALASDVRTVVAEAAEVRLNEDGTIRVEKVYAVADPGLVVSPDGARAQIQGAITMGLSSVLKEAATVKDGQFEQANFYNYPLLTMDEAPTIEVDLLESGDQPYGLGEPPIAPIAAAVANALYDLTGERLRRLPLKPS